MSTSLPKLVASLSGGETSSFMTLWCIENLGHLFEIIIIFSNTGDEDERTLRFIHQVDQHIGRGRYRYIKRGKKNSPPKRRYFGNVVWVEAVIHPGRKGTTSKVVDYKSASRKGEPFKAMVAKYGIPNIKFNHCSRELKQRVIKDYAKSIGWNDYSTAIGIRSDEIDRVAADWKASKKIYPLISSVPMTKPDINTFWSKMPFRLELKGYEGNCKVCWKKSLRKLLTIAKESPERFKVFKEIEEAFEKYTPLGRSTAAAAPYRFYRNGLSVSDILNLSKEPFEPAPDDSIEYTTYKQATLFGHELDLSIGCEEACGI